MASVDGATAPTAATIPEDASIVRFCRQYLQLERELDYPGPEHLREDTVQSAIYDRLFADGALAHPPPPRYQLRVLKQLVARIEASIEDWDQHGVSDDLMTTLSCLLASPIPSEAEAAQSKSYVTYSLSLLQDHGGEALSGSAPALSSSSPSITILESRNLISAAGTTGLRTWEAALHLGQYLCAHPSLVRGKGVLELGAGTGYVSILCAKYLGPRQVIASDGSDDVVMSLPDNFFINGLQPEDGAGTSSSSPSAAADAPASASTSTSASASSSCPISAMDLKWGHPLMGGEEPDWNAGQPVDLVLGADVTYDRTVIPALAATLDELFALHRGVACLIAATERNRETFEAFLDVCARRGLAVREVAAAVPGSREDSLPAPSALQAGPFYSDAVPIRICEITSPQASV
ncbi:hypothetical protein BX600DRAFT_510337 [Xylariales sp. PMI_506]|nr:hypothetical protein BX600DRAFT_510337 [Xylariales sp. PMI_506]